MHRVTIDQFRTLPQIEGDKHQRWGLD
jgi:hypothetical protein